jgi:hypothetical protein
VTPYTSYLIVEDQARPTARRERLGEIEAAWTRRPGGGAESRERLRDSFAVYSNGVRGKETSGRAAGPSSGTTYLSVRPRPEAAPAADLPGVPTESSGPVPVLTLPGKALTEEETEKKLHGYTLGAARIAGKGEAGSKTADSREQRLHFAYDEVGLKEDFESIDGDVGVLMSKAVRGMKEAELEMWGGTGFALKNINKRNFYQIRGVWVDSEFTEKMPALNVQFGSNAYFKLLELKPELKDILALGDRLIVTVDGKAIFISENVENPLSVEELEKALKKA